MQRLLAISWLTIKAAFRFRLVFVLTALLLGGVVLLPLVIKDDGTARGFTQILLTYTLMLITTLLGFATLWLSCGTLARDVEECQIQMVAVKPVARWQIWLGKWVGILMLNAFLLTVAGGAVFMLMKWRAQKLPENEQTILRNEVFVARGSAREVPPDIDGDTQKVMQQRLKERPVNDVSDLEYVHKQIREQVKSYYQNVPSGIMRQWDIDLGMAKNFLRDQPIFLRLKFNTPDSAYEGSNAGKTFPGFLEVGVPETSGMYRMQTSLSADTFHEFELPPNVFNTNGVVTIRLHNLSPTLLIFPLDEGMEILYREGGFGLNFARGVFIIFLWLALLAAIGLAAASFLSFPVASFFAISLLIVGLSSSTISLILEQGTVFAVNPDTGIADAPRALDYVALPIFRAVLNTINLVQDFSPIDLLSSGRSITWAKLGQAVAQIGLLFCGLISLTGMIIFSRRELATAQGTQ